MCAKYAYSYSIVFIQYINVPCHIAKQKIIQITNDNYYDKMQYLRINYYSYHCTIELRNNNHKCVILNVIMY